MKKYVTLKCSTCTRQKDELVDLTRFKPDRCTITLGCEGRLSPIGYTSEGTSVLSVPPTGLSNWYPRGTTLSSSKSLQQDSMYNTSTGTKQQIVLAVPVNNLGFVPGPQAKLTLTLEAEQQTSKEYRQYTYRKSTSFTIINGVEDGQTKKVLRYTPSDQVEVYLNGVKRVRGVDYELNDGTSTSAVPPNSVMFLSTITGTSNQVDVVVTQSTSPDLRNLTFNRAIDDESRAGTGAWEGIGFITSAAIGDWVLFYCDFAEVSALFTLDVKLRFSSATIVDAPGGPTYDVTLATMLLSRTKVNTQVDRQRAKWIDVTKLNTETDFLSVKNLDGKRAMLVTEASAQDVFPLLDVVRFKAPSLQTTNLLGDSDSAEFDNFIINGPDA